MPSEFSKQLQEEWLVAKHIVSEEEEFVSNRDDTPPLFLNMPKGINVGWDRSFSVAVPEGFFGFNHCNTKWLLNILVDGSDFRLMRMLKQTRTRILFESNRYYQIRDQPWLYIKGNSLERCMFHSKASLYMNSFGVAIYLRLYNALKVLAPQKNGKTTLIESNQPNYATHVNNIMPGDVMVFHFDYIVLKREAYGAIPHLLKLHWMPNSQSKLVYRRRSYQYVTPFMDWVDVCRNVLRTKPSLQLSKVSQQLISSRSVHFNMLEMKPMGHTMLEFFELKKLTANNFSNSSHYGRYAGRKLLHDKEATTPVEFLRVFEHQPRRPVIPHSVSAPRRFLSHTYYYDNEHLTTLSQILSVIEVFERNRFFSCDNVCGAADWHKDPLLFQINEIVNFYFFEGERGEIITKQQLGDKTKAKKVLLREQNWSNIISRPEWLSWYHRYDIMNCISLLFGILQNCLLKNFPSNIIDRICILLMDVLISSEFVEPILSFSFYDTFFALTSLTNCVPGLQSASVMRMMKKAPMLLTQRYTLSQISDMFTQRFWFCRDTQRDRRPTSIGAIGEFLVTRKRLMSMRVTSGEGGDAMSTTSAVGTTGGVVMFSRDPEQMTPVTQAEEEAGNAGKSDTTKKAKDEKEHILKYTRNEIDFRYATVFGENFRRAVRRMRIVFHEDRTFSQSVKMCREPPAINEKK